MDVNKIKGYIVNSVIGILVLGVFCLIPFYYFTKNTLAQHSQNLVKNSDKIDNLNEKIERLNDTIRDNEQAPIVIQGEIKGMKVNIQYIKNNQEKQEKKLDKIYDILLKMNGND